MGNYNHLYGKYNVEVSMYIKIAHAAAVRHQCELLKQFVKCFC